MTISDRLIVANWKMNLSLAAAVELTAAIAAGIGVPRRSAVWLAPAALHLEAVAKAAAGSPLTIGAQNVCGVPTGAFTGEISVPMVRECGGSFAIVGHSERRHLFNEQPDLVAGRALGALTQGLPIIFCVGETAAERERGEEVRTLERQLDPFLEQYDPNQRDSVTVAYEPVWSIGTGKIPALPDIDAAHGAIARIFENHGVKRPRIVYGGSVTPENLGAILGLSEVDGALVGGASLDAGKFSALVRISEESAP
jgi:triosephosphate isomerase